MSLRYSEDEAMKLMIRGQECANSESCSIEMASDYLQEVVYMQSGCGAGALVGTTVCDDVQFASEVVSSLRQKIEDGSKSASERGVLGASLIVLLFIVGFVWHLTRIVCFCGVLTRGNRFWSSRQAEFESLTIASMNPSDGGLTLSPVAAITNSPFRLVYLGVALFYLAALLSVLHPLSPTVLPFTGQEWLWSIRDGYVGDMISQTMKYGGLVSDSVDVATAVPFSGQEWWWSIRDGYVGDMIAHSTKYGGLVSDSAESVTAVSFTGQEWLWAVRDGYVGDMVACSLKNGGLVSDSVESATVPFTGQEWLWAARDGYMGNMISSSMKNGGLWI